MCVHFERGGGRGVQRPSCFLSLKVCECVCVGGGGGGGGGKGQVVSSH